MAKEYIERESLLKRNMYGNSNPITYRTYAEELIKSAPTADVVEVKHGEWIRATPYSQDYCNQCGLTPKTLFGRLPPFCPNCGAKMGEEWKDGERKKK